MAPCLQQEAGATIVRATIGRAVISTANCAEVVQKIAPTADEAAEPRRSLQSLGLGFAPLSAVQAEVAGRLREITTRFGLSLGDRSRLAVGMEGGSAIYAADRMWREPRLDVEIRTIRQ